MDNEFILYDRLEVIRKTIEQYGEDNFYLSFSGGKDSTVVHHLLDMALPNNRIPRVFANTGIEYLKVVEFVKKMADKDDRFIIIKPTKNIKATLEEVGYPFKSKQHSSILEIYQRCGMLEGIKNYLGVGTKKVFRPCPSILKYQFTEDFKLKVSDKCCVEMKEKPIAKWSKENNRPYGILGLMKEEGGRRFNIDCLAFRKGKLLNFQPLAKVTGEWEQWLIDEYKIELSDMYKPPFNFRRTGCKGCPFSLTLARDLELMEKYMPNERKQCEYIWKPVYDEYRRLGYRLDKEEQIKLI